MVQRFRMFTMAHVCWVTELIVTYLDPVISNVPPVE